MGLIINRLKQLLKGYPTVSDKYNVAGGTYEGAEGLEVGEPVSYGSATGYYVAFNNSTFAGISMAKNVKLINQYPANGATVKIEKGEAIDLFVDGYIAVELADDMMTVTDGVLTTDVAIDPTKTYYTRTGAGTEASPYVFTKVASPDVTNIATYYEATAKEITPIAEGTKAYINASGKFTSTSSSFEVGKFTGIVETNYGKALAEIVVK